MRHHVNIVLSALTAVVFLSPVSGTSAQTNWREVRSLKMGCFFTRVDVSSLRTIRLYAQLDTSQLMGEQVVTDKDGMEEFLDMLAKGVSQDRAARAVPDRFQAECGATGETVRGADAQTAASAA